MVSVITSSAAFTAVHSLRSIDERFVSSSKRIESGYRVADSLDDASIFSVAQTVRAEVKTAASVQSSLAQGQNTVQVALSGLRQIYDLTNEIRANVILLADGATAESARAAIKTNTQEMLRQIESARNISSYNGSSLLADGAQSRSFIADSAGNTITVSAFDGQAEVDALTTAVNNITDADSALATLDAVTDLQSKVNQTTADIASTGKAISDKNVFIGALVDALKKSLGALVDTDITEAAAVRQSAILQRGLSIESLAFTTEANRRVVDLLR